ncbi:complement C1q-like protein 4, partial [Littorina saxatilis]|uniref:complement C1q-like protein 4 n=1 Tax=Littorina saxatilis TaxID=31220 RepID=UPI0038B59D7A
YQTPDGQTLESSGEENGTFHLLLPNPPSGGNYTCTLPPLSPASRCLPPLSPLLEGATVHVDQVKVSFTLLEARQKETEDRQRDTGTRQQETQRKLVADNEQLKKDVTDLQARLGTAKLRISFHATLALDFTGSGPIQPFDVVTNEGDAFNDTSGVFTAPRNGTYFFAASAATKSPDKWIYVHLMKNDNVNVARAITKQYADNHTMGSMHATLYLVAGERVWLKNLQPDGEYVFFTTSFTGFLVSADV